jgi:hypothetical protein
MDESDAAQAAELVRALCDQLHEMTNELVRLESQPRLAASGEARNLASRGSAGRLLTRREWCFSSTAIPAIN